jgi:sterol 24-C-methyltransferase
MRKIKPLIGAVGTPTPKSLAHDLESAGFKVLRTNNASIDGLQSPLIERADGYFRTARFALLGLVRLGVLPQHFKTLFNRFTQDCDAFIEADRARLITTSYHWLAEKPKDAPLAITTATTNPPTGFAVRAESPLASSITTNLLPPPVVDIPTKTESPASSDRTTKSSVSSSDTGIKSPSRANSAFTEVILLPSELLPMETIKPPHANFTPVAAA